MNVHDFQTLTNSRGSCRLCGKTRNAKIHGYVKPSAKTDLSQTVAGENYDAEGERVDPAPAAPTDEEAAALAALEEALVNEEHQDVDDVEVTTPAQARKSAKKAAEVAEKAPAAKGGARVPADTAASFWVGWRVALAGAEQDSTLGAKLRAAKPTQLRYYRVHLTADEIQALDALAATFEEPGHDGYARRAARTLRAEIAKESK